MVGLLPVRCQSGSIFSDIGLGSPMAGEIFISYRRADEAWARLLHRELKAEGVEAWYDALIGPGQEGRLATAKALEDSKIFVLLFPRMRRNRVTSPRNWWRRPTRRNWWFQSGCRTSSPKDIPSWPRHWSDMRMNREQFSPINLGRNGPQGSPRCALPLRHL